MGNDGLGEYHRKRNFTRTAEPRGRLKRKTGDLFVVHKHAARRLHYDLRLELDGVLKSWAVTRGPSLSPDDKRLAVQTEDHPLEYAEFEGKIPEGEYGAGSIIVWDRGRWSTEGDPHKQLAKGHLEFALNGTKLKGRWHLVHMKGRGERGKENWLLIKADDEHADHSGKMDLLGAKPRSVKTGRSVEDVARSKVKIAPKQEAPAPRAVAEPMSAPAEHRAMRADSLPAQTAEPSAQARVDITRARKAPMPAFIEPALATAAETAPSGDGWVHEVKFDGYRLLARIDGGYVKLLTRSGLDWTDKFPPLKTAFKTLPASSAFIDGEVVVETERGAPDFGSLQTALSDGRNDRFRYYAFDLLHLNGFDLRSASLLDRKAVLSELLSGASDIIKYGEHLTGDGKSVLKHACRLGLEGIVSKLKNAPYRSGRTKSWIKSKCADSGEFVIIGYVPSTTERRLVGSLVVGHARGGKLNYAGRVGSGFPTKIAEELWKKLEPLRLDAPALDKLPPADVRRNVRWTKPVLIANVEFRGWTTDNIIRHAVFKGLRPDKSAQDIKKDGAVAKTPGTRRSEPVPATVDLTSALTHPDRLLWPDAGVTKQGLAEYWAEVWPWVAPFLIDRPLALVRCPGGVQEGCFFQKHAWAGISDAVIRTRDPQGGEEILAVRDVKGLMSLTQASVLEVHAWGATLDDLEKPDAITFDLDPDAEVAWADVVSAALEVRERLRALGLDSFVKTTGGKGLHVLAPLKPHADWAAVKAFAHEIAKSMARDSPQRYLAIASKSARRGRIFIDYLRNGRGATAVTAYSPRTRPAATISTPLAWEELGSDMRSDRFTLSNILNRLSRVDDPWKDVRKRARRLPD